MIDRITDAGQCDYDYYEAVIKIIKQGLSDNCLKRWASYDLPLMLKGEKLIGYCKQHRTTDFRI